MLKREIRSLWLQGGTLFSSMAFFGLVLFYFSLALGSDLQVMRGGAPAFFWVLVLLTTLFTTPQLLKEEANEGLLDEVLLLPSPPAAYLLTKIVAEMLLFGLPLILLSLLLCPFFSLPFSEVLTLSLTLLIGFPALSALGILGGLLTLHARGGGLLLPLLILPLTLPLLLFALSVIEMERLGLDSFPHFCLLTGVSLLWVMIAVGAGSWALRFAGEG